MPTVVTTTHLEMLSPDHLRAKSVPRPDVAIAKVPIPQPELNRFFYSTIGSDWFWYERLPWSYSEWMTYLDRPELQTWIVSLAGIPAGYFELESQPGRNVELVYFGLLRAWIGSGLGGWALSEAVRRAWDFDADRVWVHTCDLDHPGALSNYQARGFTVFKTESKEEELPELRLWAKGAAAAARG